VSGPHDPAALAARLPPGFVVGAATSAFQIEGAPVADGRTRSVWDDFAARPGAVVDGSDARVAADSYRRWADDVALLRDLGVDGYRFSLSWPRLQPGGRGPANPRAIAHYDRFIDALLDAGIRPMVTLFHWDTPAELEAAGGWLRRETALRFAEYAALAGAAFGDRVDSWVTVNEPATVVLQGYALDVHAPARAQLARAVPAAYHMLLGHGLAVRALRAAGVRGRVGITNVHSPVSPATPGRRDRAYAALFDVLHNRLFADPVLLGRAPAVPLGAGVLGLAVRLLSRPRRADLAVMHEPVDFYGLNYYFPTRIATGTPPAGTTNPDGESETMDDLPFHLAAWPEYPRTGFGWPVAPDQLGVLLHQMGERYGAALPPVVVTEGGASFPDVVRAGEVDDPDRVDYLARHIAVAAAGAPGVRVQGYYVWSLLDNWEWAAGFTQRFGLVHVDFGTGVRTPKRSFGWLREVLAARTPP
jgi:beta-glucosidase